MNINFIQIFEQFKKFIQQENWSWFSLFLYLIVSVFIGERLVGILVKYNINTDYSPLIIAGMPVLFTIIRFFSKTVLVRPGKINIWIADLLVIHISDTTILTYEQKMQSCKREFSKNQVRSSLRSMMVAVWNKLTWSSCLVGYKLPLKMIGLQLKTLILIYLYEVHSNISTTSTI